MGFLAKIAEIKTAWLYRDLEGKIYMECPQDMTNMSKVVCIILNKCISGLIKATRQYYKKAIEILKKVGLIGGNVDPCLYMKKIFAGQAISEAKRFTL